MYYTSYTVGLDLIQFWTNTRHWVQTLYGLDFFGTRDQLSYFGLVNEIVALVCEKVEIIVVLII